LQATFSSVFLAQSLARKDELHTHIYVNIFGRNRDLTSWIAEMSIVEAMLDVVCYYLLGIFKAIYSSQRR
jgi:hypothetical protein